MSDLYVTVKISGGTPIEHACNEACALATRIGIWVHFEFNGVSCNAAPHSDPTELAISQQRIQDSKTRYPMAFAHPIPSVQWMKDMDARAARCPNMAHKRYNMSGCDECSPAQNEV